jgi:hypothetical protein
MALSLFRPGEHNVPRSAERLEACPPKAEPLWVAANQRMGRRSRRAFCRAEIRMFIESVTLQNFRCFGPRPTTVTLESDLTALIGANGAGKTAFIEALRRLFGPTREERAVTRADVHFGSDEDPDSVDSREVVIDVVFAFPELRAGGAEAVLTVPAVFRFMTASGPGEPLKARIRLEAEWRRGESFVDEVDRPLLDFNVRGD